MAGTCTIHGSKHRHTCSHMHTYMCAHYSSNVLIMGVWRGQALAVMPLIPGQFPQTSSRHWEKLQPWHRADAPLPSGVWALVGEGAEAGAPSPASSAPLRSCPARSRPRDSAESHCATKG